MPLRSFTPLAMRVLAATLCALVPNRLPAVDAVDLTVGDVRAPSWTATGIHVRLELGPNGRYVAQLSVEKARFADPIGEWRGVEVTCPDPVVLGEVVSCRTARISVSHSPFGPLKFAASASFDRARTALELDVKDLMMAGGTWQVSGHWRASGWEAVASAHSLSLADLRTFAKPWMTLPADIEMDGTLSPVITLTGRDAVDSIRVQATVETLTLNNADGTLATDRLSLELDAALTPIAKGFRLAAKVGFGAGQAYRDPIFFDLAKNRIDLELAGDWNPASERLTLASYSAIQHGVLRATGSGVLAPFAETFLPALDIELALGEFPGLYKTYLQPLLVNSDLKDLATRGALRGSIEVRGGSPAAVDLDLDDIGFDDAAGRMAMHGLTGHLAWREDIAGSQPSRIAWRDGNAYGFSGGAADIRFLTGGREFRMLEPTQLPVFDGGLAIAAFEVHDAALPSMTLLFDATLEPISMRRICRALGWPEFAGTVAGRIPRLTLKDKVLSVDGDLEARVFDGSMVISKLRLEDPLGTWPRLSANVNFDRLDLEAVTGTFSFGEITGRLSGYIRALELFAWRPMAFDAVLATPSGDRSEHRISQRAISNISAIGGGGSGNTMATLSSGVLKFFESFKYDRLGLACRLENDVCTMQGIGPARNGYYIVKGRGIPRIDVIGSAGRIDWPQLVANLKAATHAGPATTGAPVK